MIVDNFKPTNKVKFKTSAVVSSYLNPMEHKIVTIEVGQKIQDVLDSNELSDVVIYKDDLLVSTDYIAKENDVFYIYVIPEGGNAGNILKMVAMIAIMSAVGPMMSAYLMEAGFAAGAGLSIGGSVLYGLGMAAVGIVSMMALNKLIPPDVPTTGDSLGTDSATYGWGDVANQKAEGAILPILLGTHRIKPPYINAYVTTAQDGTQTLNQLFALNLGKVNGISNIMINNNYIGNYNNTTYNIRNGLPEQSVMGTNSDEPDFTKTRTDFSQFSRVLNTDWYQFQTHQAIERLGLTITFQGLGEFNDSGDLVDHTVTCEAQYSLDAANWHYVRPVDLSTKGKKLVKLLGSNKILVPEECGAKVNTTYTYEDGFITGYNQTFEYGIIDTISGLAGETLMDSNGVTWYKYNGNGYGYTAYYDDGFYNYSPFTEFWSTSATQTTGTFTGQEGSMNLAGRVDYLTCTDKTQESRVFYFESESIPEGIYFVRIRRITPDSDSIKVSDKCLITSHSEYLAGVSQRYPSVALLAIKALATDQLSGGLPTVSALVSRNDLGDGKMLYNPAWACRHLIVEHLNGTVNETKFSEWASYCQANGYSVNIYIETQMSFKKVLDMIASLGQGYIFQKGLEWDCRWEAYNTAPVQAFIFNDSNIAYDSYNEQYLSIEERFNTLELTYFDAELDYERNTIIMQQDNVDIERKTNLVLYGCTSREMAIKLGKIALRKMKYETLVCSWSCDVDALHCGLYDIVYLQHSAPKFNNGVGSLVQSGTIDTVTLDQEVTLDAGVSYRVRVQHKNNDTVDERFTVPTSVSTVTKTLTVTNYFSQVPQINSKYTFNDGRYFKIINISKLDDLRTKITAIEYVPEIYNVESDVPVVDYTPIKGTSNIEFKEFLQYNKQGNVAGVLNISFLSNRLANDIYISTDNIKFSKVGSTTLTGSLNIYDLIDNTTYYFKVNGVEATYTFLGKFYAPEPITNLIGSENDNRFYLSWTYVAKPLDFKEYRIYLGTELIGSTIANSYETKMITGTAAKTFYVCVVDTSGVESTKVEVVISIAATPVVGAVTASITLGRLDLSWTYPNKPTDFKHYNIYDNDIYIGNSTSEKFTATALNHLSPTLVKYSVTAVDLSGNESAKVNTNFEVINPTASGFASTFEQATCILTWNNTNGSYKIASYEVTSGNVVYKSAEPRIIIPANWSGTRAILVKAIDTAGNSITTSTNVVIDNMSAPNITAYSTDKGGIEFSWTVAIIGIGVKEYIINYNGNIITTKETKYFVPLTTTSTYELKVQATDWAGNNTGYATGTYTITMPDTYSLNTESRSYDMLLTWSATKGSFDIKDYKVDYNGVTVYTTDKSLSMIPSGVSPITFTVTPRDLAGNFGSSDQVTFTPVAPVAPTLTTNVVGKDAVISIAQTKKSFDISHAEVSYDGVVVNTTTGATSWTVPVFWDLDKTFSVVSVDVLGNRSSVTNTTIHINEGVIDTLLSEVVDNNVMLKWSATAGTLPIEHYSLRKGDTYATAEEIGIRKGTFTAIFERDAGTYTYWMTPIDTAGNEGVYKGITTSVSQPPDFVLNVEWASDWSGTKTNIYAPDTVTATLPVNTTETYANHFTTRSWSTINDQINAGYPLWLTPSNGTSTYVQTFDYGVALGSTNITLSDPIITLNGSGSYSFTKQISTSLNGTTWVDSPINSSQAFVTNIRYVKVTYVYNCSVNSLLTVGNFNLRLDAKILNDSGTGTAVSTDAGGTVVNFNKHFVDITSINVTPSGTTPLIAIYDFVDVPNPTSFKVLLYTTAGVRANGNFSWSVKGY